MSVHRCVYLLTRTHLQHRACAIPSSSAAVFNPVGRVCMLERPVFSSSFTRRSASSDSSWRPPDTSLFVPLAVKRDSEATGSVGVELTRPLDKSNVLEMFIHLYGLFTCCATSLSVLFVKKSSYMAN